MRASHTAHAGLSIALAMLAGTTGAVGQDRISIEKAGSRTVLKLDGRTFHTSESVQGTSSVLKFSGSPLTIAVWQEHSGGRFAISNDGARIDQIATTENLVRLKYATFDPLKGEPMVPNEFRSRAGNELYLVQFLATPLDEMRAEVRALGGEVLRFLTDNTHVVRIPAGAQKRVAGLPHVRWVGEYHPAYRFDPALLAQLAAAQEMPAARYSIECMRVGQVDQQSVSDVITRLGGVVHMSTPEQYRLEATLTREQLLLVAGLNEVSYIDPWGGPAQTDMDIVRQVGGAAPLLSNAGFLGQGVRGEVFDTGVVPNHVEWNGQVPLTHNATNLDSHGNACYGINFATGVGNPSATGLLPQREQGIFSWAGATSQFGGGSFPSRLQLNAEATDPSGPYRSVFQTSSVGSIQTTLYNALSAEVDDYLFRVDYLSCQSQSNTGNRNSRPQAWAKNIVSVGGIELNETVTRDDDTRAFASIGPAADLRVKPDLSHAYGGIFTTYSGSLNGYGDFGGTSGATPITAGHFGLLHQMWHEGVFPNHGGGTSVFASRPRSTTAKALLINGAYRYPINAPITNNMYRAYIGWGSADFNRLYPDRLHHFIVNASDPLTNAQSRSYELTVAPGAPEFRATLVYPDPMAATVGAQARVNDLTLKVTAPTGEIYYGNNGMVPTATSGAGHLAGAHYTTPGGSPNTYDTVENVAVAAPAPGLWTVEVIASQVVQDGYLPTPATDAVYSLVVSSVQVPPPLTGACCIPDAPCTTTTAANCLSIGGTYMGDGLSCGAVACPPSGACCGPEGTCMLASAATCAATGGAYQGDGVPCVEANCGPGACCFADGTCSVLGSAACVAQGGVFSGSSVGCAQANCPQPQGVYLYSGPSVPIPDGTAGCGPVAVAEIQVPDSFTITEIGLGVYIRSAYQGDQRFRLVRGGTTINLVDRPGVNAGSTFGFSEPDFGAAASFGSLMSFSDSAGVVYDTPGVAYPGIAGTTGTYRPKAGQLDGFIGQNAQGVWRLEADDCASGLTGSIEFVRLFLPQAACYANCDESTTTPVLNVADFTCYLQRFAAGEPYANCDASTAPPVLNVADFTCFLQRFAAGCP